MALACLNSHKEGCLLSVRVTPKASQSKIQGISGDALKVSLHAPPSEGQANQELIHLLAKTLALPKRDLVLLSGEKSRTKILLLRGMNEAEIAIRLAPCLGKED